jgi:hypothetical protein
MTLRAVAFKRRVKEDVCVFLTDMDQNGILSSIISIYIYVCSLFNDAVSSSDYRLIASNDRMIGG